jgi:thermitase
VQLNQVSFLVRRLCAAQTTFSLAIALVGIAAIPTARAAGASEQTSSLQAVPEGTSAAQSDRWVLGRILVAPKAGLPATEFDKILKANGAKAGRKLHGINVFVVELPIQSHGREHALAQALARNPHIKFAEVDSYISPSLSANDSYFPNEWHLSNIGATTAWNSSIGSGVTIAILDSGVDATHPDLAAKIVPGYNFFENNTNTADVYGHGTKSAGTAAAVTNNGVGVSSVAWNSKIMPIRVAGTDGWATWSALANGTSWAADHGARVISMSFQNPSSSASVLNAASYARSKGAVVIGAAGNTSAADATAASDLMTIVAATDSGNNRASWSTYGPSVDIAAPGVGLYTTTKGGGYATWSGTSAATPVVAGVAALIIGANPALRPADVDKILYSTALDVGTGGRDDYYGYGRVDAAAAMQAAIGQVVADTQAPSVAIAFPSGGNLSGIATVNVSASDDVGVTRVELYAGGVLLGSDSSGPYSFSWDTTTRSDGAVSLMARAYDATGNAASSNAVSVNVANNTATAVADVTPPKVSIGNPSNGARVNGNVSVSVDASDNVALAGVSLYIDGALAATGNGSLSYRWNTRKANAGGHTIQATARDVAGNSSTQSIQVTK